ncbi:MAG: hypothetical protein PHY02_04860 [Phycisphaerae bacterium]|nr:hypothetical protein [Phycisphaerae bacterium]
MRLNKREPSGREKNEEAVKLLEQLREKLYVEDISAARRAAYNLSWKQEDGLEILKEALYGNSPRTAKIAAVYGLRNMHGRMKKIALAVLEEGLKHRKADVKKACNHALSLTKQTQGNILLEKSPKPRRLEIREIPRRRTFGGNSRTRDINRQNPNRRMR